MASTWWTLRLVNADIFAENGMFHENWWRSTVQPSIDEFIENKPGYSVFRNLIWGNMPRPSVLNDAMTIKCITWLVKEIKVYVKNYNKQASSGKF